MNSHEHPSPLLKQWLNFSTRFYLLFLLLAALLIAWATPRTLDLYRHINTDLVALLPEDYPIVQELFRVRDKAERGTTLNVILEAKTPQQAFALTKSLQEFFHDDPGFSLNLEKTGYDFLKNYRLVLVELDELKSVSEELDRKIQQEKLGDLYIDFSEPDPNQKSITDLESSYKKQVGGNVDSKYYQNPEGTIYSLSISSTNKDRSLKFSRSFVAAVKAKIAKWQSTFPASELSAVYFAGKAINQVTEYESLLRDLKRAGLISGFGILILLLLYFRSVVLPILAFIPMLIGLILSFAVARFWVSELNVVTAFLYSVLSGLGIENGIHFISRYRLERKQGASREIALFAVMNKTGRSIGFSVLSVSLIFFSLMFNDFKGFSQFGLIAGLGLFCVYISYMLFFPPLVVLFEKLRLMRHAIFDHSEVNVVIARKPSLSVPVLVFAVLFTFFSLWVLFAQQLFNYDLTHLRAQLPELSLAKEKHQTTTLSGAGPARVVIHNEAEAEVLKQAVKKIIQTQGEPKRVDSFFSYYDLNPRDQDQRLRVLKEIDQKLSDPMLRLSSNERQEDIARIREELRAIKPVHEEDVPQDLLNRFKGEYGEGVYALIQPNKLISLDDGRNALALLELIGEIKTPEKTFYPASDPLIYASVLKTMLKDAPKAIAIAVLIVILLIWFDVRSFKTMLLITLPIFLGELWLVGGMWFFGMKLDFYNMVIVPVVIGMSIDNCIHIYHRFEELGRANLRQVLKTAGLASAIASSTNALGFLGLAFTNHGGLASLGQVAILGLGTTLLSTVAFFPAMLSLKKK